MLLAQPLAPARQGRTVKRQIMAEADLAAEELHVRAVEKAGAQHLVGQALHVLEDHQAGHQPHRQGRLAGSGFQATFGTEPLATDRTRPSALSGPLRIGYGSRLQKTTPTLLPQTIAVAPDGEPTA